MCGIAGFTNSSMVENEQKAVIKKMKNALAHRGPDQSGIWTSPEIAIGHTRLAVVDIEGGQQPMARKMGDATYILTYNGELYNTDDVRNKLKNFGHKFHTNSDTEVLLVSFIQWGKDCLSHLNGIFAFAIWNTKKKEIFAARDRFGVKPFYFTRLGEDIIFASEQKALFEHPKVKPALDANSIAEIFALAPAHSPGNGVFKGVQELKSGHYLIWRKDYFHTHKYWGLESYEHTDGLYETATKVRQLFVNAVRRQLVSDVPLATLLSGGLDSTAISAIASKEYNILNNSHKNFLKPNHQLTTYSFDYKDNARFFKRSAFQPDSDEKWALTASKNIGSQHITLMTDTEQLVNNLEAATIARDLPGMADVDTSLLDFCRQIKPRHTVVLSGDNGSFYDTSQNRLKMRLFKKLKVAFLIFACNFCG